jgi:hypothetical protein
MRAMPHFSHTIDIERSPLEVWRAIGMPERWFEGYLETRSRSEGYPGPDTRDEITRAEMRRWARG